MISKCLFLGLSKNCDFLKCNSEEKWCELFSWGFEDPFQPELTYWGVFKENVSNSYPGFNLFWWSLQFQRVKIELLVQSSSRCFSNVWKRLETFDKFYLSKKENSLGKLIYVVENLPWYRYSLFGTTSIQQGNKTSRKNGKQEKLLHYLFSINYV